MPLCAVSRFELNPRNLSYYIGSVDEFFRMKRRDFLQRAGLAAGWVAFNPLLPFPPSFWMKAAEADAHQIGVIQGPTCEDISLISVVAHRRRALNFQVTNDPSVMIDWKTIDMGYDDFVVHNLRLSGLQLGREYELQIFDDSGSTPVRRLFKALDWSNTNARLAVLSCTNIKRTDPMKTMCARLGQAEPDAILFLGDLVYANRGIDTFLGDLPNKPDDAYSRYVKTMLGVELYQKEHLTPIFYMWDDHDAGANNANASHPHMNVMVNMFRNFFPMERITSALTMGPGLSFALQIFGTQIVVLDQRTFGTKESLLGSAQLQWALEQISSGRGPLIMASPQVYWRYHWWGESFEKKNPAELAHLLDVLKKTARPTLFVSGDVHYSQIQEVRPSAIGFKTYEITSSALFSRAAGFMGRRRPQDGQIDFYGKANFILLDRMSGDDRRFSLRATCFTEAATPAFVRDLTISTES